MSKRRIRGIARSVELRPNENGVETLLLRVDRYDSAGNRMTPVGVEMKARRAGRITDGDEVEVAGRWSRGTLQADKITNLTTASEVVGFPRWAKWAVLAVFLMIVAGVIWGIASVILTNLPSGAEVDSSGTSGSGQATFSASFPSSTDGPAEQVLVPGLLLLDEASAISILAAAGLLSETLTESSESVAQGNVIRTDPHAGTLLFRDNRVILYVSSGPSGAVEPPQLADVSVPSVAGMDEAAATHALVNASLVVALTYEGLCTQQGSVAIRTDPAEGTIVPGGSSVTLVSTC